MKCMSGDRAVRFFQVGGDSEKGVQFVVVEHAVFSQGAFCGVSVFGG